MLGHAGEDADEARMCQVSPARTAQAAGPGYEGAGRVVALMTMSQHHQTIAWTHIPCRA